MNEGNPDVNSFSVIELLTYRNFKALFIGDAQALTLEKIDSTTDEIDLLKVPHHGSEIGLNSEILNILNPKIAAISGRAKNRSDHPNSFTLDLLNQSVNKILRTDQIRNIEIISDGDSFSVKN